MEVMLRFLSLHGRIISEYAILKQLNVLLHNYKITSDLLFVKLCALMY